MIGNFGSVEDVVAVGRKARPERAKTRRKFTKGSKDLIEARVGLEGIGQS